jgi:type I restriction enzyme S subunit
MFFKEANLIDTKNGGFPADWTVKETKDLFYIKGRIGWRGLKRANFTKDGPFLITGVNFKNGAVDWANCFHVSTAKFLESPEIIVQKNDILLTKDGTIGKVARINEIPNDGKATINAHIFLVRNLPNNGIYPLYTYYTLQSSAFLDYVERSQTGSTRAGFAQSKFEKLPFPVPSYEEQQGISEVLSTVDHAIQRTDEIITKIERLWKGLMQVLLTKGIGHNDFRDSEIGRIPKEWELTTLAEVAQIHDSKRIPLSEMERGGRKGGYPYCGANGIIDYIDAYIFQGEFLLLAEDGGDYGEFGNSTYIMTGKFWVNNHAHVLQANLSRTTNLFLRNVLNFLDLNRYIVGSTRKKLNQESMKQIKLPLPPLGEQQEINSILTKVDTALRTEFEETKRLERIKQGLMEELLTGKVRAVVAS